MNLVDLTAEQNFGYRSFMLSGLQKHRDCFRISPLDEVHEPFPTLGKPDSYTLGLITTTHELAGVVSFQREGHNREKIRHKGLLFRMYVASEYGGRGLGRILLDETIRRARRLPDMEQINLTVIASNALAKRHYEKAGFRSFALEKNAIKDGDLYHDEERMVLFLKQPTSL